MAIVIACRCGLNIRVRDEHAGTQARCPDCGALLVVPDTRFPANPPPASISESATAKTRVDCSAPPTPATEPGSALDASGGKSDCPADNDSQSSRFRQSTKTLFIASGRVLHEVREVGTATASQAGRVVRLGWAVWQQRTARRAAEAADVMLGQRLYDGAFEIRGLREQVAEVNEQIRSHQPANRLTRGLQKERRGLLRQMAVAALGMPGPSMEAMPEWIDAREALTIFEGHRAAASQARTNLAPAGVSGWLRVAAGVGTVCCIGLLSLIWITSSRKPYAVGPSAGTSDSQPARRPLPSTNNADGHAPRDPRSRESAEAMKQAGAEPPVSLAKTPEPKTGERVAPIPNDGPAANRERQVPPVTAGRQAGLDDVRPPAAAEKEKPRIGADRPADLRRTISAAGFDKPQNWVWALEPYVRFGSKEAGDSFRRGDQFGRIEVTKAAAAHRADLRKKRFRVDRLGFRVADRDDVETKGLVAECELPLRVRGSEPFHEDLASFTGTLSCLHPSEVIAGEFSFLTKDRKLRRCIPAEALTVLQNDGVLYHPERGRTTLILIFKDKLDVLKDIARNAGNYSVEIELTELCWERPISWGFYKRDAYIAADWDCQRLWADFLRDMNNPQPVYFATAWLDENEGTIPEMVRGRLTSLRIVDKNGKSLGGYRIAEGAWSTTAMPLPVPGTPSRANDHAVDLGGGVRLKMVRVPGGTLWAAGTGRAPRPPPPRTEVAEFYLGAYEVRQAEWTAVMGAGNNPSQFRGNDLPVERVSWDDAQAFVAKLNEKTKGGGFEYRLPSEAEWEYACRGGPVSQGDVEFRYYFDRPTNDLSAGDANFDWGDPAGKGAKGTALGRTVKVGSYRPNKLGLYDMHGNVWEWTATPDGQDRVIRGGSWLATGAGCAAASRGGFAPDYRGRVVGFRLAASPSP